MKTRSLSRFAGSGSSVLVVFLMLLLVTLGAFAMVSSNSNLELAKKGVSWFKHYYLLEAGGETIVELISQGLLDANERIHTANARNQLTGAYVTGFLSHYFEKHGPNLPHGTTIDQFEFEYGPDSTVLFTAKLSRTTESVKQHLAIEIKIFAESPQTNPGGFRILKWKQYQEPFEYEQELDLWQ